MSTSEYLVMRARDKGLRIATAESCTAGLLSAEITDAPGSSDIFECGFITYSNASKERMLGVNPDTIKTFGAVSEEVAREMAEGALERAGVDIAVAITGIAGPGGSEHKPEGRVCFALARKGARTISHLQEFGAMGRENVRKASMARAFEMLADEVG